MSLPSTVRDLEQGDVYIAPQGSITTLDSSSDAKPGEKCQLDIPNTEPPSVHVVSLTEKPRAITQVKKKRAAFRIRASLWYNTYRKLFTITVIFNTTSLVLAAAGNWDYPRHYAGDFVLGNILAAVLVRNELFGRLLYLFINTIFAKWSPLWFRLSCTSILQHLGGIHSGCASSSLGWLIFRLVLIFNDLSNEHKAVLVAGIITTLLIAVCITSAFPWVRNNHHNVFERHHRFIGWLGLISTWIFVILGESYDVKRHVWNPDGIRILRQQDFWLSLCITAFIAIPWLSVRKVEVHVEIPSPKAAILRFERGMQQGLLARISRGACTEYHAFGIVSEGKHAQYHYLICGVQGDFTRGLVVDPPTHIWTRQLKFAGISNTSSLYRRGIRVCTGTGLGAALSTCLQSEDWYLIWIGSDQEKTFGPTIVDLVRKLGDKRVTLWDSKKQGGRPDVMKLVREAFISWQAEVVFITSNLQGNTEIMEGCKQEGIPAFGTLWDF